MVNNLNSIVFFFYIHNHINILQIKKLNIEPNTSE